MANINMCIRIDSELKVQAEEILSQLGMNMNGTINMFLRQIVRERAVPLRLSLASSNKDVAEDLYYADFERRHGFHGYEAKHVIDEMDDIIASRHNEEPTTE